MKLSMHPGADQDLTDAFRFYKREAGTGVARRFLTEFERVTRLLHEFPDLGTPTSGERRVYPLTGFPYSELVNQSAARGNLETPVLKVINYLSAPRFDLASARDDFFTSSQSSTGEQTPNSVSLSFATKAATRVTANYAPNPSRSGGRLPQTLKL